MTNALKYLEMAFREGIAVIDSPPPVVAPRLSLSIDARREYDLWFRLPRFVSGPLIRLWLRRAQRRNGDT